MHNLDRFGVRNSIGHANESNFLIALEGNSNSKIVSRMQEEFMLTIPFFYGNDYSAVHKSSMISVTIKNMPIFCFP